MNKKRGAVVARKQKHVDVRRRQKLRQIIL